MKKKFIFFSLIIALLLISGCAVKKKQICTTAYPIEYLVEKIGEPHIEPCNITSNKVIQAAPIVPDFEKRLSKSDALFYVSGLEPYFEIYNTSIREVGNDHIDFTSKGYFYPFQRYSQDPNDSSKLISSPYYEGDLFNSINKYKKDPFLWMDPLMMISAAEMIRDYLIIEYPEYEKDFEKNYDELEIELTKLDADFQLLKENQSDIAFVSITPSFGNWQNAFGVSVYPVILSRFGALPSDAQLEVIKQRIRDDGVRYIAHEQNLSVEMEVLYEQLVEELDLIPIELSNLSSRSQNEKNKDYLTIMYENLSVLESIGN